MTARTAAHVPRAVLLALPPHVRRRALATLVLAVALAVGYLGWLRDSSLVAVEEVKVTGLTAPSAERIERALQAAGEEMTTLHVRPEVIEQAVAGFPVVKDVHVSADFPHALHVRVVEHRPVALLESGGDRVPVAGDGTLLPDVEVAGSLPSVAAGALGGRGRVGDERARALVAVAAAAPRALLARAERIAPQAGRGIVVELRDGPELLFGDGSRARAKWLAASAVLADASSSGASYIDLRIPERPAAGGVGAETVQPVDPAGANILDEAPPAPQQQAVTAPPGQGVEQPPTDADPQPQLQASPVG